MWYLHFAKFPVPYNNKTQTIDRGVGNSKRNLIEYPLGLFKQFQHSL